MRNLSQKGIYWNQSIMSTKIGIIIRSFGNPFSKKYPFMGFTPETSHVRLPDSRVLYTVLRSPHIDKKSREQFEMRIKKQYMVMKVDPRDLEKKFFWLKRQRILGAQYEVRLHCKTRLDPDMLRKLVSSSSSASSWKIARLELVMINLFLWSFCVQCYNHLMCSVVVGSVNNVWLDAVSMKLFNFYWGDLFMWIGEKKMIFIT